MQWGLPYHRPFLWLLCVINIYHENVATLHQGSIGKQVCMEIEYDESSKEVVCYRQFVLCPTDRSAIRAFNKKFGQALMKPAIKLHDRLKQFPTAEDYNAIYGTTENRIELKKSTGKKDPLILKVRVSGSMRKFFNHIVNDKGDFLLKKDWEGNFSFVKRIFVIAINNHKYEDV